MGTFEAKMTLSQTVLYLLKNNVRGIAGANAARESSLCILMTVYRCLLSRGWSKYKFVIKKGTSELDEAMKKDSHYLFTDPGVLGEIIKCPTPSNVPEGTKDKKRKRSGRLIECINISFSPSRKQRMFLSEGNKIVKG